MTKASARWPRQHSREATARSMEEAETLRTVAELSVAIAGFTGVVVVFGGRVRGEWTRLEADRLWLLLAQALFAAIIAFLPILLRSAGLADPTLWRVSNGACAAASVGIGARIVFRQGLARAEDHTRRAQWWAYCTFAVSTVIVVAQIGFTLGLVPLRGSFLFLLAVIWVATMAASNFWQLLMGSVLVRDPRGDSGS